MADRNLYTAGHVDINYPEDWLIQKEWSRNYPISNYCTNSILKILVKEKYIIAKLDLPQLYDNYEISSTETGCFIYK